jgi:SAM-dependent methyltransferase
MLTDRHALTAHRARALRIADQGAWFAHDDAALELQERLIDVNRTFTAPAVVTGHPERLKDLIPGAKVVADTDVLDLEEGAHDLVVHFMSLHWADDPVGQLVQCRRALKPDGLFLGCAFGGDSLTELRAALGEAEVAVTGGLSPRVLPMGEVRDLGALLQRAGLALPVADVDTRVVQYRSLWGLFADLRATGETNALAQRHKAPIRRELIAELARIYQEHYAEGDGLRATVQTIWLTGWAPSADQPKPLRPGSAQTRLADALGVPELGRDDEG